MSYISEHCTFAPITDELLSRLNDFYCHHETDISDFFKFKAVKASEELMSKSYCLYDDENNEMVAAFCVLHTSLPTEHLPNYARRNINKKVKYEKQRKHYPATLIGQFAVFDAYSDKHLGDEFLSFVILWILSEAQQTGNRFVIVDAINNDKVLRFYERNGFKVLFRTEDEELIATGKSIGDSLPTRMMFADLINYTTD